MKKSISLLLGLAIVSSLVACSDGKKDGGNAQQSNPFVACESLDEASGISGFDMSAPESISNYPNKVIEAIENDKIQVTYSNDTDSIQIRKAIGSEECSGDYSNYKDNDELEIEGLSVSLRGSESKANVATWANNNYSYSIVSTNALDKVQISDIVGTVNGDDSDTIGGDPATWGPKEDCGDIQISNPFVNVSHMEEAIKLSGFDMKVPSQIEGFSNRSISVAKGDMIQVTFGDDDHSVVIRKALGEEDCSGDFNTYEDVKKSTIAGKDVVLEGDNGKISLVTWTTKGYSYSISMNNKTLSLNELTTVIKAVQ